MNLSLRTITLSAGLLATIVAVEAQGFEGVIEFTKTNGPVVTDYKYYVKGDQVRIEELNFRGKVQGIMLVDNKKRTVTALSPDRKLFMDVPNMRLPREFKADVRKTGETKQIAGYTCEKWTVKSPSEDRQLTYWVANDGFDFFIPLLETLNRKDEQALFFLKIDKASGVFPMLGVEQKIDGSEVSRLEVTKVSRKEQGAELFSIPAGFTKFERN